MKRTVAILILSVLPLAAFYAAGADRERRDWPRFTFGIEGGYTVTFANYYHFNFISADGDRINIKENNFKYTPNGTITLNAGVNVTKNLNLSVNAGYTGIERGQAVIPLTFRSTWLFGKEPLRNRWLTYISAGAGFGETEGHPAFLCAAGGGYRISLNRFAKLDLLLSYQGSYMHPPVYETVGGEAVTGKNLRRNNAYISAISIGIGLNF